MPAEIQRVVKRVLQDSPVARSAPQIRKELPKALQMPPKELVALLEGMVAGGEVFVWPGKRFWDRNPQVEARRLILGSLEKSVPTSAARVKTALKLPLELVEITLKELVAQGRAHLWQPAKTSHYCLFDPRAAVREIILKALSVGPLTERELIEWVRKKLPQYSATHLREDLSPLLLSRRVLEHPRYGKMKARYGLNPPDPGPYLEKAVMEVKAVHKFLSPFEISLDTIFQALGQALGPSDGTAAVSRGRTGEEAPPANAERAILEGITRLQPLGQRRALVSIRELRRSLRLAKSDFDTAVLSLALKGRVALHYHDFPSSLSPEEREELVRDERGTYYVGIVPKEVT